MILPFLKSSFPVFKIFRVSAGDWRLWSLFGLGAAAAVSIWHGLKLVIEKRHVRASNVFAIALLVMAAIGQIYYIPYIDPVKSAKKASGTIEKLLPQQGSIAFYRRRYDNAWNFYLDRAKIDIVTLLPRPNRNHLKKR